MSRPRAYRPKVRLKEIQCTRCDRPWLALDDEGLVNLARTSVDQDIVSDCAKELLLRGWTKDQVRERCETQTQRRPGGYALP